MSKGETELAELLEGRVAGEPVRCLTRTRARHMQIVDETAFVFRSGSVLYVNRPSGGASSLDQFVVPVFRQFGGTGLCRLDTVELRDRGPGFFGGPFVQLGDFVPYRKVEG